MKKLAARILIITGIVWALHGAAVSSGGADKKLTQPQTLKPSLELIEYVQKTTLELQNFLIHLKDQNNPELESLLESATNQIHDRANQRAKEFKRLQESQLEALFFIYSLTQKNAELHGISFQDWKLSYENLKAQIQSGNTPSSIEIKTAAGSATLFHFESLRIGKQQISKIRLSSDEFWQTLLPWKRRKILKTISANDELFAIARKQHESFTQESFGIFSEILGTSRFEILAKLRNLKKSIQALGSKVAYLDTSSQYSDLYNRLLEDFFSFGFDANLDGNERTVKLNGFLLGGTMSAAVETFKKLRIEEPQGISLSQF